MRILVVEDETEIAGFIQRGLEDEGYAVDVAADGHEGIDRARSVNYDLMVLDLMLPKMGGLDVLRQLRSEGKATPVLVLTARDARDDKVNGLDAGADDYLTKPFDFDEFTARIRALLRRRTASHDNELKEGDLTINLRSRLATRGEREIHFSSREFALLEYLMRNSETVLSRTQICEKVWGQPYDGISKVVDVYINYLRNKLEEEGEPRLVHTVRGHGYVFRPEPAQ